MKQYWTWALGGGQAGQAKNVVFLPLPQGQPSESDPTVAVGSLDVSLRPGQGFAIPVFVFVGETYAEPAVPDDLPSMLPDEVLTGARILVTLDGKPILDSSVDDVSDFFFDTVYFDEPLLYDEPVEYAPDVHAIGSIWVKGVGLVHQPLSKGAHTLRLSVYSDENHFGFDNTWNITVGK
jgi:hypothetical protein